MFLTNDQYQGLHNLERWYYKSTHQIIEISGITGTGIWQLLQNFIDNVELQQREIMYLSYDQHQVLNLAYKRYHAYYINSIIYNYTRIVDFNTLPVINSYSKAIEYEWKKSVRKKIDPRYKLIIVFDSMLLNVETVTDLASFGLPIILIRDPMLLPVPDTYTFLRDANIILREAHPDLSRNPLVYFAHKVLNNEKWKIGTYDNVSIVPRKQMNLYNLRSSEMIITLSDVLSDQVNRLYRERILKKQNIINVVGERLIVMNNLYKHKLVNKTEKKVKVFLTKGTVGTLTKCNHHVLNTKYVPIDFKPQFYDESFDDLVMDRHYLNNIEFNSRQIIPDETILFKYAYALPVPLTRVSHWDKVTLITDPNEEYDDELQKRLIYTAITRAKRMLTIIT